MDLDSLLTDAAPPVTPRTADVRRELVALVDAAEAQARPHRRRRVAIVAGVAVAAIGATAATTAAVGPGHWVSWLSADHQTCRVEPKVGPAGPDVGNGEPNKWPAHFDYARRDRMLADAQAFIAGFDYTTIDVPTAVRIYQAQEAKLIAHEEATEPADEVQPPLTGNDLTGMAIAAWVDTRMDAHLAAEGYDMSTRKGADRFLIIGGAGWRCDK